MTKEQLLAQAKAAAAERVRLAAAQGQLNVAAVQEAIRKGIIPPTGTGVGVDPAGAGASGGGMSLPIIGQVTPMKLLLGGIVVLGGIAVFAKK